MKNYSRRTSQKVTRYRTPSTFRIRQHVAVTTARTRYGNTLRHRTP